MSKTNYSKVEKALDDGLQKMVASQLLDLADAASNMGKPIPSEQLPSLEMRTATLKSLDRDLKKLHRKDAGVYKKVGFVRSALKKLIDHPDTLTPEDWKQVKKIKEKVEVYKKELAKTLPQTSDDTLVESERVKHINKRFNTNENWLPLK